MDERRESRNQSHTSIIIMLVVAAVLPLFFAGPGAIAGLVLALIALGWLLRASDRDVRNRIVLLALAVLAVAMNGVFSVGFLT